MPVAFICRTCGVQYAPSDRPPERCVVCTDPRQYVGWDGQIWTTLDDLDAEGHRSDIREEEPGLVGIGVEPSIGIGQRSLLVTSPAGNLLWDVPGFVDDDAIEAVEQRGGIVAVSASHPHFYGVMAEWSKAFDVPALLPEADRRWAVGGIDVEWYTDSVEVTPDIRLVRCGGHFPGSAVAHWTGGSDGAGVLMTGDSVSVVPDREWVSFMWSYPNLIPLDETELDRIAAALDPLDYERIYGGWWGRAVSSDGRGVVQRSMERYRTAITDTAALEPD